MYGVLYDMFDVTLYIMDPETLWIHKLSHSESSGNHAVKIYAQCMNYRISAKILNYRENRSLASGPGDQVATMLCFIRAVCCVCTVRVP